MNVDCKRVRAEDVILNPLLEKARLSTGEENPPELHWIRERNGDKYILWQPEAELPEEFFALVWDKPEEPRWKLTINLWRRYREISPLEKAFIIENIAGSNSADKIIPPEAAGMLLIPYSDEWLQCYRRLTGLSSTLRQAVNKNELSPKLLRYIFQLPEDIGSSLLEELEKSKLRLTVQQARQFSEAFRKIPEIRIEKWVSILREAYNFSSQPGQRAEKLLELVRKWAYPRLSRWHQKFDQLKKDLELWSRLEVQPPENFEGQELKFKFSCGDRQELKEALDSLQKCRELLEFV